MHTSFFVLLVSAFSIGFFHSLAPDHWMPFVMIGRAQKWTHRKLFWITLLSGIGHVGSSIVLGLLGLFLGIGLMRLQAFEGARAQVGGILLIGFGLVYAVWGLKHAQHKHMHDHEYNNRSITIWSLIAIFILGPCEPLIPLMFLATVYGAHALTTVTIAFSATTIAMMLAQSILVYSGVVRLNFHFLEKYTHAIAGFVIAVTGILVWALGI